MTWLLFLAYLAYTFYQKNGPNLNSLDQASLMQNLLVLSLTMIGPFFVAYMLTRATQLSGRTPALLLGFIAAVGLCVTGYWAVWKYFGGFANAHLSIEQVLQLGLVPGLVMGAILAFDSIFRRSA